MNIEHARRMIAHFEGIEAMGATLAKLKTNGVAVATLEAHDELASYEDALRRHRMAAHDLATEMIRRQALLEQETLKALRELQGEE
jgi:2-phospho-L-lactate transferase/gluconeogenesis factor (CofD/UPF0052 family)